MYTAIRKIIEAAWENRELLKKEETRSAIDQVIGLLDKGKLRTATPTDEGWQVNEWVKKAVILYFPTQPMSTMTTGPFEYHDKIRLKQDYAELGVRVVPPAAARYGAYVAPGVVMMPSYVNIGAYVDSGTMVDTWATVGSCAQIGKNVHLSGGVGIGGVFGTGTSCTGHYRGQLLHRFALYYCGRCPSGRRSRAGCEYGNHRLDQDHRRHGK